MIVVIVFLKIRCDPVVNPENCAYLPVRKKVKTSAQLEISIAA